MPTGSKFHYWWFIAYTVTSLKQQGTLRISGTETHFYQQLSQHARTTKLHALKYHPDILGCDVHYWLSRLMMRTHELESMLEEVVDAKFGTM